MHLVTYNTFYQANIVIEHCLHLCAFCFFNLTLGNTSSNRYLSWYEYGREKERAYSRDGVYMNILCWYWAIIEELLLIQGMLNRGIMVYSSDYYADKIVRYSIELLDPKYTKLALEHKLFELVTTVRSLIYSIKQYSNLDNDHSKVTP